jgi:putative ABC transport system ATP-binding protein
MQVFRGLNTEGRTVVLITHESDIAAYTKRVVHLRDGRIVSDERHAPISRPEGVAS